MELSVIVIGIGLLIFLAHLFSLMFERFHIPDVLFLFGIGIVLGPVTGVLSAESFGQFGSLFALLTLLIMLFEAGLDMKIRQVLGALWPAMALMVLNLVGSIAIIVPAAYFVFGIPLHLAFLVSILVGGISSGIVIPLAEQLKLGDKTKAILALESNLNNVVTVVLILALLQFSDTQAFRVFPIISETLVGFLGAVVLGGVIALVWSRLLLPIRGIQDSIFTTPAVVLIVYGLAEFVGTNGIMAAFAFGITLGNLEFLKVRPLPLLRHLEAFHLTLQEKNLFSGMVFLLKTYFFVFIGISMNITNIPYLLWGVAVVLAFLVLRDATARLVLRQSLPSFDLEILKRMMPKGLVGAALVSLVANQTVQDLTYPIILFSVVFTSLLIFWVKRKKPTASSLAIPSADRPVPPPPFFTKEVK